MSTKAPTGFWAWAKDDPARVAVIEASGREVTAGQLLEAAHRLVHALRARGLGPGAVLIASMRNRVELLELYLAAMQAGWYFAPIAARLTAHELTQLFRATPPAAVFFDDTGMDAVVAAATASDVARERCFAVEPREGMLDHAALRGEGSADLPADRTLGEVLWFTSGTTGTPRPIRRPLVSHTPERRGVMSARHLFGVAGIAPHSGAIHLVTSPLYHSASLVWCTDQLHLGHRVVLMGKWTAEGMLDAIARHRVSSAFMVPTHFHRLLALGEEVRARYDVSSLRHVVHGGAPCSVAVKRQMLDWWGPVIYEVYGAAELDGGLRVGPPEWLAHPGTVGKVSNSVRVLRDDGTTCAPGEVGTLHVNGRAPGDLGYVDEDGYLFLCDRKVDMIISGGVNVYPAEIEAALGTHPAVADVAVFGVPDDEWGESVKAVVEPRSGVEPSPELVAELQTFCRGRLAGPKCPRSIDFVAALPRDENGKLYKRELREPYWAGRAKRV